MSLTRMYAITYARTGFRSFTKAASKKPSEYCVPVIWRSGVYISDGPQNTVETFTEITSSVRSNITDHTDETPNEKITKKVTKDADHGQEPPVQREPVPFQLYP